MNFLAHLYLSGDDPLILTGNFMGDFFKASTWKTLPQRVGQGVLLHRLIDSSTDEHPESAELRSLLHPACGKYAGIALDVLLDHYLANDRQRWSIEERVTFVAHCYEVLKQHQAWMPPPAQQLLKYLSQEDWLNNYSSLAYTLQALHRMEGRIGRSTGFEQVGSVILKHGNRFELGFHRIFETVERRCLEKLISFDLD